MAESEISGQEPGGRPAAESGGDLREALERAEATAADNWDRYLRAVADADNIRKRAARDAEAAGRAGIEKLAAELLAVADSLELAGDAGNATAESLLQGQQATLQLLQSAFDKFGIERIDPAGAPFDPQLHEAMSMLPSSDMPPGHVLAVLQKGYRLNERLLRPARVIVAGEPASRSEGAAPPD